MSIYRVNSSRNTVTRPGRCKIRQNNIVTLQGKYETLQIPGFARLPSLPFVINPHLASPHPDASPVYPPLLNFLSVRLSRCEEIFQIDSRSFKFSSSN